MNQKGISLVEVLMAAGIAGGIALTVAKLSQDSARVTKTAEANNEINNFISDVSYILSDKVSCNATISGSETIGSPITSIRRVRNGSSANVYELDPKKYGNNSFSITGMRTAQTDSGVSLLVDIQRTNLTAIGSKQITKHIPLKTIVDGTTIKSCFSDTESMIELAARSACKGNSARWDDETKECHHTLQSLICESGKVMQQIVTDEGEIKAQCVPIIPTPMNCGEGYFLKAITTDGTTTCEPMKTTGCGLGQYALGISNGTTMECRDIPKCNGNQNMLRSDPISGELTCVSLMCDPANQYFAGLDLNGFAVCKNFPDKTCGQGQYIKEVKNDGTVVCGDVPNHLSLSKSDFSFVDGFDSSTNTWSRKDINQIAQQICQKITGHSWNGTTCIPPTVESLPEITFYFGGMWGESKSGGYKNPFTNSKSCPYGYSSAKILGTINIDYDLFFCYRKSEDRRHVPTSYYAFGGVWGESNSGGYTNPYTGSKSCPSGYSNYKTLGTTDVDHTFYFCYKNLGTTLPNLQNSKDFGGMWGYGGIISNEQPALPNPATSGASCPPGFNNKPVFGTNLLDWPIHICYR